MDLRNLGDNNKLQVFMISERANYSAIGFFDGTGIMVQKGSTISRTVTSARLDVKQRTAAITPDGILKEDTYFDSPSAAAQFVCGRSANGWVEWKTITGVLLQEYRGYEPTHRTPSIENRPKEKLATEEKIGAASGNIVGLEGNDITIEVDALAEERSDAHGHYKNLRAEHRRIEAALPYPDVKPYDTVSAGDLEALHTLKFMKAQNQPIWDAMSVIRPYFTADSLYSGHIRYSTGGDRYFTEILPTKDWRDQKGPFLINVDDKKLKAELDAWHYPDKSPAIAFSRNITMDRQEVQAVDIVLDRSDSMYAHITDNYLRNALKRNKDKTGFQSIIQTIQQKQDNIRSLEKDRSFVVQGCAGSGKTMVLLHRLRYLIYNKDIYGEDYYFLVPSTGFKKYIRDITTKFNITYGNVLSYQGYYRMLLGKADTTLADEISELVFPADYLSRVYSKPFMQECYNELFDLFINQTNGLTEFCEDRLNALIASEEERIGKAIASVKNGALAVAIRSAAKIAKHIGVELEAYEDIASLIPALDALIEKQTALLGSPEIEGIDITIASDDERITSDEKWQALNAEVESQTERVRKASIFTVNSHKKKHQQLIEKRETYQKELVAWIIEEEKKIRAAEVAKLSVIFDGVTIADAENARAEVARVYETAERNLSIESDKQQNIMEVIAAKHNEEISSLTQLIEASGDLETRVSDWIENLVPATEQLKEYLQTGIRLYSAFSKYATEKKEQEDFREKFKLFARRTDREQQAYLNTLLLNICKKKIKTEFNIKICELYKHYWYILLYCNYLISGNTSKARPYVYIDEAQDLSISELELIRKLNNQPVINLFGDINQVITAHGVQDWTAVDTKLEVLRLDENFRNTNQIVDFCNSVLPFQMQKIGVDMEGVEQLASVDHALSKGALPNGVTFIVKDELATDDLKIILKGTAITDFKIYTVKEAKGLEFKHVIVIDRDMTSNEKYISYTRALAKLTVIHALPLLSDPSAKRIVEGEDLESV